MAHFFGVVEDKLWEADFFLEHLRQSNRHSFDGQCFFSAFVSAARSVTLAMQASLKDVAGFESWYVGIREKLKTDPLAPYFVEIRNDVIHTGINRLNQVSLEHLKADLSQQLRTHDRSHVLILPDPQHQDATVLVDAVEACSVYFTSLVAVVFECYQEFRTVVDPRWYFTQDNFATMGKTFEDAVSELGFPSAWASCAPPEPEAWRVLRRQQPQCLINDLFDRYVGRTIPDPDEDTG